MNEPEQFQTIIAPFIEDGTPEAHVLTAYEYRIAVFTLRAAHPHHEAAGVWRPLSHLIGMCAELSMKAFLLVKGLDGSELKSSYGHKLSMLLTECISRGLVISETDQEVIRRLTITNDAHYFRYGREPNDTKMPWPVPVVGVDKAMKAMVVLLDAAARAVGHPPLLPDS